MALTVPDPSSNLLSSFKDDRPNLPPAPSVAITPCDPWPRPYYLENGLRRVAPYHYTYNTFCKARWRGREILDIFAAEFRDRSREYYRAAIEEGRIVLNGTPCQDIHTIVNNGDVISHTLHRHEPPVTAQPIRVVHESAEMIVIDKPAGVPVHPAGRYKYNSVTEIMRAERHFAFNPLPCNRLDRLTSGVMFIGKTSKEAEEISAKLRGRTVRKEYMARVKGRFPDGEEWDGDPMRGGVVKCEEAILQISPVLGLNRARASGKSAKTLFRRIAYYPSGRVEEANAGNPPTSGNVPAQPLPLSGSEDEGCSIVHCLPLTGRTHQIRVHLQFLGHPISNDPIYSNRRVFGPDLAKGDASGDRDAEIQERLGKVGKTELADAYSYGKSKLDSKPQVDSKAGSNPQPQPNSDHHKGGDEQAEGVSKLIDQTQRMTVSEAQRLEQQSTSNRETGEPQPQYSDYKPLPHGVAYKPLPNTLHAGSLLPSPSSLNPSSTTNANTTATFSSSATSSGRPTGTTRQAGPPPDLSTSDKPTNSNDETYTSSDPLYHAYVRAHDEMVADYNKRKGEKLTGEVCDVCQTPLYSDPGPQELGIYLHALAYADLHGQWRYTSPMPTWALPPGHAAAVDVDGTTTDSKEERRKAVDGPTEAPEWLYEGPGAEGLTVSVEEEREDEKKRNETGTKKNKIEE